jgi:spore germination protein GerM
MKYLYWIIGIVLLAGVLYWAYKTPANVVPKNETEKVYVFLTRVTNTDMEFVPVQREVAKTNVIEDLIKETLTKLIEGPTAEEKASGLSVSFNAGTIVNYVKIESGTLTIDFNNVFDTPMGGSTRVASIAQDLTRTIQQFPLEGVMGIQFTVNNGERTAVLEP